MRVILVQAIKLLPFIDRNLKNRGFVVPELFVDSSIIEKYYKK